jgi:argininosuccinate lyase
MKGLPLSYNRDMQEDKQSLFDAYDIVFESLSVFTQMIFSAEWNIERMALSCVGGFSNATDVAEYLVRKGLPFRSAHEVSAKIVRACIQKKCNIEDLPLETLREASPLIEKDIYKKITPAACVEARNIPGGPAAEQTRAQIQELAAFCAQADTDLTKAAAAFDSGQV